MIELFRAVSITLNIGLLVNVLAFISEKEAKRGPLALSSGPEYCADRVNGDVGKLQQAPRTRLREHETRLPPKAPKRLLHQKPTFIQASRPALPVSTAKPVAATSLPLPSCPPSNEELDRLGAQQRDLHMGCHTGGLFAMSAVSMAMALLLKYSRSSSLCWITGFPDSMSDSCQTGVERWR